MTIQSIIMQNLGKAKAFFKPLDEATKTAFAAALALTIGINNTDQLRSMQDASGELQLDKEQIEKCETLHKHLTDRLIKWSVENKIDCS